MAWDSAGNTYISDGYVNSRVAKVDKNGNWIKSWGEPGDQPGQLNTPHSIAVDAQDNVYVADRGNRRIQVFDGEGKFLRQIVIDVPFDPEAPLPRSATNRSCRSSAIRPWRRALPGPSASRLRPTRCCTAPMAIQAGSTSSLWMGKSSAYWASQANSQNSLAGFMKLRVRPRMNLFIGELLNWRVQKLVLEPVH